MCSIEHARLAARVRDTSEAEELKYFVQVLDSMSREFGSEAWERSRCAVEGPRRVVVVSGGFGGRHLMYRFGSGSVD